MALTDQILEYINRCDRFGAHNNMRIVRIGQGEAEAELAVSGDLLNGDNVVQGGAIYTLADLAFAGAANGGNENMVTQSSSMTFIRPGTGTRLRAIAKEVHRGRRTGLYTVDVFDDQDRLVARGNFNGFATGRTFLPEGENK